MRSIFHLTQLWMAVCVCYCGPNRHYMIIALCDGLALWWIVLMTSSNWKHFPRYWTFVRGIHRSSVNSPHIGQWRGALMFSLICVWINGWVNNREAGDLRRYRAHYDVTLMFWGNKSDIYLHLPSFYDIGTGQVRVVQKSFLTENREPFMWHGQCHGCWWPGSLRRQGINSYAIDPMMPLYMNNTMWQSYSIKTTNIEGKLLRDSHRYSFVYV